jgi:thiol-disulfide isomerase/thioredoxin
MKLRACLFVVALALTAAAHAARPFDAASMAAIERAHAGKPFVLAFWSIHCAPCLEDMADWRTLRQRYPGVPVILVNTDSPAEAKRVAQALARYSPGNVEQWAMADDFAERVRYSVDRTWRGELPRTYFFDRAHKVEISSGRIDPTWTDAWFRRMK